MAQVLDKQGLQHYANKMCNADNRKVGSKSLPTVLNDIDIAIDGFKTLFETEYGTPVNMELENNENVFSVGTGTNIDKRSEIENSFTDIELSGNSLVNLYIKTVPVAIQGVMTNNNDTYTLTRGESSINSTYLQFELNPSLFKANTTYTVILTGYSTSSTKSELAFYDRSNKKDICRIKSSTLKNNSIGIFNFVDYNSTKLQFLVYAESVTNASVSCNSNILILEGDWTNKPIPQYFEGIKSVGEKEDGNHKISISSFNNGNVIVNPTYKTGFYVSLNNGVEQVNNDYSCTDFIRIESNKKIRVINTNFNIAFYNKDKKNIPIKVQDLSGRDTDFTTITPKESYYVRFSVNNNVIGKEACYYGSNIGDSNLNIALDKKEISLNEPLRGLPNGVKDTIEKINGEWKIVRRCGEIILNGSEDWSKVNYNHNDLCTRIDLTIPTNSGRLDLVCNNIPVCADDNTKKENFYIAGHNNKNRFVIVLPNSKLSSATIEGAKEWLSKNNATVVYLLPTPIIEDISPVTLQCWKNGTISIDEVLPVESTHTVALNKSAQIQKNIEELSVLRNRIETLEKQYNNSTLNQAYELELLRLDMELDNIV